MILVSQPVFANRFTLPFNPGDDRLDHLPDVGITTETVGEGDDARESVVGKGQESFREIAQVIGSFLTLVLGSIAVVALFVAGYKLVSAQTAATEEMEKQRMNVVYIMFGLVLFALSSRIVYDFLFFDDGDYLNTATDAQFLANLVNADIKRILNLFLSFSGAGAILMLIVASLRLVINPGSDEQIERQKKLVAYTAVGIIIIGLSDTLVNRIFFAQGGTQGVNVGELEVQLQGLANYVLGFLGVIVFVSFVISGVMYVIYFGNDDVIGRVKTTMRNVVIGSLVAFSAYTIVATLLRTFLSAEQGAVTMIMNFMA